MSDIEGRVWALSYLDNAIKLCPSLGLKNLVAYIFSHNRGSLELFRKHGFKKWGELPEIAEIDGDLYSLSILGLAVT